MKLITHSINFLTKLNGWIAATTLVFLMMFITFAITSRFFNSPVLGVVEIIQVSMVILIMASLSYTEYANKHIAIGIIVDRFPTVIQLIFDIISRLLTLIIGWVVAYVFYQLAVHELSQSFIVSTSLLKIPHYPLKFFVAFGFFMWGLQALLKMVLTILKLIKRDFKSSTDIEGG
ncbi:hypothetical protein BTR23_10780 [Alkalihalophilus pseudofirmus]|nr:hypothetical protein BTR23_10780 [Alkalihalophilus pseudofirmus]